MKAHEDNITCTLERGELIITMHALAMEYARRGNEEAARIYDKLKAELMKGGRTK